MVLRKASSLDLNMVYYHIKLSLVYKKICMTILSWGNYEYQKIPMGVYNIPDIYQ